MEHSELSIVSPKLYDAIVIGAGPAGCSSAYFLKGAGQSVLILEKSSFPRDKVCGEFISPAAWKIFDQLQVREALEKSGYIPIQEAILYSPSGKALQIDFESTYGMGLSRSRLDDILLTHAKSAGVEVLDKILVVGYEKDKDGLWVVKGVSKNSKIAQEFKARRVISACGRCFTPNQEKKRGMFGFKAHYQGGENLRRVLELFFLDVGYGGLVQIEDGMTNACFLLDIKKVPVNLIPKRPDDFMIWVFDRHPILKKRMSGAMRVSSLLTTGPLPFGLKTEIGSFDLMRVGDALGVIDPFLGEGIALALESGYLVARSLNEKSFKKLVEQNFRKRFFLSKMMRKASQYSLLSNISVWALSKNKRLTQYLFKRAHDMS